ncbi:hypothetical protein [Streptosporangium subroseum]|nr:hypothetical protein OHB15_02485 [Streptosporangium subroseum]
MIYEEGRLMALTPEQRAYALAKAAEARRVRGELLAELRYGDDEFR